MSSVPLRRAAFSGGAVRAYKRAIAALTAAVVAGLSSRCGSDSVGPRPIRFDHTYALIAVDGRTPPAIVANGYILIADTVRFSLAGAATHSLTVRRVSATMVPPDTVYRGDYQFPYAVEGRRVIIGYRNPCPPNANCVGFEEATMMGPFMKIVDPLFWPADRVLTFHRIPRR
jgi:hypothetical protein